MAERQDELDRILARGRPSGPQMDAMWEKISSQVSPEPAWKQAWSKVVARWWLLPAPLLAGAAALVILGTPVKDDRFVERGGVDGPVLQATCGGQGAPCPVGKPVFLRLGAAPGGVAYVALASPDGQAQLLAGPVTLRGEPQALDIRVTPEKEDVTGGLTLQVLVTPSPQPADEVLQTFKAGGGQRLQLRVVP